jgi:hypothetical protein
MDPKQNVNPYATAEIPSVPPFPPTHEESSLQVDDLRVFVGKREEYYLPAWAPVLKGYGHNAGFNWCAFFFTVMWMAYRKMYFFAFLFMGVGVAVSIIQEVVCTVYFGLPESPRFADRIATLIFSLICGSFGNRWYLYHAQQQIAKVQTIGLSREESQRRIASRGGTSLLKAVLFMFVLAAFVVLIVIAAIVAGVPGFEVEA